MSFWILTFLMALAVAALLLRALTRPRAGGLAAADYDIAVYRAQLDEVDRDLDRGVIGPEAAERARVEISRRILDADRARTDRAAGDAPRWAARLGIALAVLVPVAGAFGTYLWLGAPGYGDLALKDRLAQAAAFRENRPGQAAAEAGQPPAPAPEVAEDYAALVEQLRQTVAGRQDDPRGWQLLAENEANLGNFAAAHAAQKRLVDLKGAEATAADWTQLAEFYVMAAGGYVSPEAEAALDAALALDPGNGAARYYAGVMYAQTGRPDLAFRIWRELLEAGPSDAPWIAPIRAQIEEAAFRAGARFSLPPEGALPGPSAGDMAAAQDMSPEERQQMIRGMVEGLAARLAAQGGAPEEWARLIGALAVLGETERARAIYAEAEGVFAADPAGLATVRSAAEGAGL